MATVRALKMHGGLTGADGTAAENRFAVERGMENLAAHIDIVRSFGVPCVVGVNAHPSDSAEELRLVCELARDRGADDAVVSEGFGRGGAGAEELAKSILIAVDRLSDFRPLNPPGISLRQQVERIAAQVYGAGVVEFSPRAERSLAVLEERGMDQLPACMAKTHLSLSHDPKAKGRPRGFSLPVRDLLLSAGAGFVVALCGDIMLMPGLGKDPAVARVDIDEEGRPVGLF